MLSPGFPIHSRLSRQTRFRCSPHLQLWTSSFSSGTGTLALRTGSSAFVTGRTALDGLHKPSDGLHKPSDGPLGPRDGLGALGMGSPASGWAQQPQNRSPVSHLMDAESPHTSTEAPSNVTFQPLSANPTLDATSALFLSPSAAFTRV